MTDTCPICHRAATLAQAGRYRHNSKIEDRLCQIQLKMINLKLEERELLNELKLTTAPPFKPGE